MIKVCLGGVGGLYVAKLLAGNIVHLGEHIFSL